MYRAVLFLLLAGVALFLLLLATAVLPGVDRAFTRLGLDLMRTVPEESGRKRAVRERLLQSIHSTSTYTVYATKTFLYAALVAVASSLVGVVVVYYALAALVASDWAVLGQLPQRAQVIVPAAVGPLATWQVFVLVLASTASFGLLGGGATYFVRWWLVRSRSEQRRVLLDESLARTIAFVYALSRSGMAFPQIMRTVGRNRRSFGQSAEEIGVVVKDMDLFGADLGTALERIARRSPSEQFGDFAENLANVIQSGQNVPRYLREQYDHYQDERVANQERLLELFAALGEAYVAGLVAGPLFLITILLIFGILSGGMLGTLSVAIYLLVPAANIGFLAYVHSISEPLSTYQQPVRESIETRSIRVRRGGDDVGRPRRAGGSRTDGGTVQPGSVHEMNAVRLATYNRLRRLHAVLVDPFETVVDRPGLLLYLTVPLALLVLLVRGWSLWRTGTFAVRTVDDLVIQSTLFVVATFAVVYEIKARRLRAIEAAVPDLLERLANTNEAGMTFTESLRRIDRGELGVLNVEVERLLSDIDWGARTEKALQRFNARIGSSTVSRVVALLTNAMAASGNLAPVIRIAADEAREDRRLQRTRRQEMFMYVIIIYLAFVIFIAIGITLETILIPAIPGPEQLGSLGQAPGGGGVALPLSPATASAKAAYTLLLFHAAMVQAVCSGLVAGQMGEGDLASGAKHVAVLVAIAYVVFLVIG